ncbi:hypothetical protein ACFL4W_00885 [Planctomycetota bacterium]
MTVSQAQIAAELNLDRTTVNKILNGKHNKIIKKETVEAVLAKAREMGYDFSRLRRYYSRGSERIPVDMKARITIRLLTGEAYDMGSARILNLSLSGTLLSDFNLSRGSLPLKPFEIVINCEEEDLDGIQLLSEPVRIDINGSLDIGVRFKPVSEGTRAALQTFLTKLKN